MTALFILALIVWSIALLYAIPGAVSAFGSSPRHGDPMRAGVAAVAFVILLGSTMRLFDVRHPTALIVLFVLVNGAGLFTVWLMRTYGRGGRA